MLFQLFAEMLKQEFVVHLAHTEARLVNDRDHALVRLLNEVANDFVVEKVHVGPVDVLPLVLFLLLLQDKLNEELLQLLVAIVYTKLLEAVVFEHFKAVDVQHADHSALRDRRACFDRMFYIENLIDATKYEREQFLVHGLTNKFILFFVEPILSNETHFGKGILGI